MTTISCSQKVESGYGRIRGHVIDAGSKTPVAGCEIILSTENLIIESDGSGSFEFNEVPNGNYSLIVTCDNYHTKIITTKVVTGLVTTLNIELESLTPYSISCNELNFGEIDTEVTFEITNHTSSECSYTINDIPSWLKLSQSSGKLSSGNTQIITATINRSSLNIGEYNGVLNIKYVGSTTQTSKLTVIALQVKVGTPVVTCSSSPESLKENAVTLSGTIVTTGGVPISQYGHCWSTSPSPTIADSRTKLGTTTANKDFTSNIIELIPLTTYYIRAYATNSQGTSYSSEISITTPDVYSDVWNGETATSFAGGSGTATDPYIIKTGGQLMLIKQYSTSHFVIANNIDLNNHNWQPLALTGKIDGKGYIISNLRIERSEDYLGLFAHLGRNTYDDSYGEVKNITIKGVYINAPTSDYVGALVGRVGSADNKYPVQNCKVILTENSLIKGNNYVGGIVGVNASFINTKNVELIGCTVESTSEKYLIVGNSCVGGIVGSGCTHQSKVEANIQGGTYVGGICGVNNFSIENCSYKGTISGSKYIGGICGEDEGGGSGYYGTSMNSVRGCKAIVDIITTDGYAGGIVGDMSGTYIVGCYADGQIRGEGIVETLNYVGGIRGEGYSNDIKLSYSTVTSTLDYFDGIGEGSKANDCFTTQTAYNSTQSYCLNITKSMMECYSDYASYWNFDNTWTWRGIVNGQDVSVSCPRLAWE